MRQVFFEIRFVVRVELRVVVIRDKMIADKYTANWKEHAAHSDKYEGKDAGSSGGGGSAAR